MTACRRTLHPAAQLGRIELFDCPPRWRTRAATGRLGLSGPGLAREEPAHAARIGMCTLNRLELLGRASGLQPPGRGRPRRGGGGPRPVWIQPPDNRTKRRRPTDRAAPARAVLGRWSSPTGVPSRRTAPWAIMRRPSLLDFTRPAAASRAGR